MTDPAQFIAELDARADAHTSHHDGVPVRWRVFGNGPPLVLLHGGYGSWLHWIRNIEGLSKRYRLLIPDAPGHGESRPIPDGWTVEWMGAALAAGVEELTQAGDTIVGAGFSMGGLLLGQMGIVLHERLTHAVFIGPNGLKCSYPPMPKLHSIRRLGPEPPDAELDAVHRANLGLLMLSSEARADALAVSIQRRNIASGPPNTEHLPIGDSLLRALPQLRARFGGIWGEHDAFTGPFMAEREAVLREHEPTVDFRVVPGAGHWVVYEAPDTVNAMLFEMLTR